VAVLWVAVLGIIATVQLVREVPVDAAVFAIAAAVLLLDAAGLLPATPARRRIPRTVLLGAGLVGAALLALAPRHGVAAGVLVAGMGIAVAALAWPDPPAPEPLRDPRPLRRAMAAWGPVVVVLGLSQLASWLLGRPTAETKLAHPAVSELLDPLLDHPLGQALFAAAWVAAGIGLLTRGGPR